MNRIAVVAVAIVAVLMFVGLALENQETNRLRNIIRLMAEEAKSAQSAPVYLCGTKTVAGVTTRFALGIEEEAEINTGGPTTFRLHRQAVPCERMRP